MPARTHGGYNMAKKALLVASFGSTHEDTIKDTITAAERDLALAIPDRQLYTAWTSRFIRRSEVMSRQISRIVSF